MRAEINRLLDGSYGNRAYDFAIEAVHNKNIGLPARIIASLAQVHGLGIMDISGYWRKLSEADQKNWNEFISSTVAAIIPKTSEGTEA